MSVLLNRIWLTLIAIAIAVLVAMPSTATAVTLRSPADGATVETPTPILQWALTSNERTVAVQVFDGPPESSNVVWHEDSETSGEFEEFGWRTSIRTRRLDPGLYYWRVIAENVQTGEETVYSEVRSFRVTDPPVTYLGVRVAKRRRHTELRTSRTESSRLSVSIRTDERNVLRGTRRSGTRATFTIRTSCFRPGRYRYRVTARGGSDSQITRRGSFRIRRCRMYFPSRCFNPRRKPDRVIVACGDGNFQVKRLRWRAWDRRIARGRGTGWVNDCNPYCAAGHFHSVPVRVRLSRRRWCGNVGRHMYTRFSWRFAYPPPGGGRQSGHVPFGCGLYDLF